MLIGVVGSPNCGKSTFFSAATLVDVEIGNRPFVTIKPNQGTGYVSSKCVHGEKQGVCQPMNSLCENGTRLIPVTLLDVAGLVPDAHKGRGLGNSFMSDLMQAKALIQVIDVSGKTDVEGNPTGGHDPAEQVRFLEREVVHWIKGILTKNWERISKTASVTKKVAESLGANLSGLGISEDEVKIVLENNNFSDRPEDWGDGEILRFCEEIRKKSKPMLFAANKIDVTGAKEKFEKLKEEFPGHIFVPCSAEAELALRRAAKSGVIEYVPGSGEFKILKEDIDEKQKHALEFIREQVLGVYGSTGVQEAINRTAFELLNLIVVYPVQDANKWVSGHGNYLPDAYLMKKKSNSKALAGTIHTDFVERYIGAVNCRTGQRISENYELQNNDVIKILLKH